MKKYKFLGNSDKCFPDLKKGKIYELDVCEVSEFTFLWFNFGKKFILATGDINCPYSNWKSFFKNWKLIS